MYHQLTNISCYFEKNDVITCIYQFLSSNCCQSLAALWKQEVYARSKWSNWVIVALVLTKLEHPGILHQCISGCSIPQLLDWCCWVVVQKSPIFVISWDTGEAKLHTEAMCLRSSAPEPYVLSNHFTYYRGMFNLLFHHINNGSNWKNWQNYIQPNYQCECFQEIRDAAQLHKWHLC